MTTTMLDLFVDWSSLTREGANVHGVIYVRCNEQCFPDDSWNDFVVIVVNWWVQAALELLEGRCVKTRVRFMEGPYRADLEAIGDLIEISVVHERLESDVVLQRCSVRQELFIRNVARVAYQMLDECKQRGWSSPDIDDLKARAGPLASINRSNTSTKH